MSDFGELPIIHVTSRSGLGNPVAHRPPHLSPDNAV